MSTGTQPNGVIFWIALTSLRLLPIRLVPAPLILALLAQSLSAQALFVKPVRVLGDPHFIATAANPLAISSAGPNGVEGKELQAPTSVALDKSVSPPILYIADSSNNRVLGYQYTTQTSAGAVADLILGQPDRFTTNSTATTALRFPTGLAVDSTGNLYVADNGNNRVVRYPKPFAQPAGYQFPDLILGQTTFAGTAANTGGVKGTTLSLLVGGAAAGRAGLALDSTGNLFVADLGNNRVLRFPPAVLKAGQNGPAADLAIGQADLVSAVAATVRTSKIGLSRPTGVAFDASGRLFITDALARVVVYLPGFGLNARASRILGVDPNSATNAASAITLGGQSQSVALVGSNTIVTDSANSRLLVYGAAESWPVESTQFSPSATQVIGQTSFSGSLSNGGDVESSASALSVPQDVAASSTELYVADSGNNRVLVYPVSAGVVAATAGRVIGQPGYPYRGANQVSASEFSSAVAGSAILDTKSVPPHLYVADTLNNRVLGYRDFTSVKTGQPADIVIGQPDFLRSGTNYPSGKAAQPSRQGLNGPRGLALDSDGNLYVADTQNARVLRFPAPFISGVSTLENADLVIGQNDFSSIVTDPTRRTLGAPIALALSKDGFDVTQPNTGWLLVADAAQNRVMLFSKPFSSGMIASNVLGTQDFTSGADGTANSLSTPGGVASDPNDRVVVADSGNGRILIYPAIAALAQGGTPPSVVMTTGLNQPITIAMAPDGKFWVADNGQNVLLHYTTIDQLPLATPAYSPDASLAARTPRSAFVDQYNNLLIADGANRVLYYAPRVNVANAANYIDGRALAAGTFASIFAVGTSVLSIDTAASTTQPLPTVSADTQVIVNGKATALSYVSPAQINLPLALSLPAGGTVDLQVVRKSTGQIYGGAEVPLSSASPALFVLGGQQSGPVAALNTDNTVNTATNPVPRGTIIQLFGTGQGPVLNPPPDGESSPGPVETAVRPQVILGSPGVQVPVENIKYSGLAPNFVGLWQINVEIPLIAPSGSSIPITVYMNSIPSTNPSVPTQVVTTISIK